MLAVTGGPTQPVPMLDFSRHYSTIRDEVLAAVAEVCNSQQFIQGPTVGAFEASVAKFCRVPHAAGCASGTDALWLALAASGVGPGDRVLTTPFSFFSTVSAILRCGATPVLADIDPRTFNLAPERVEAVLRHGGAPVKAILPVHLYGQCADWDAFSSIAASTGALLIEDAAQAFGAEWGGTPAGALGDAAAFSFYPTKNLAAAGDAGLVTTRSADIDARIRSLRGHGMTRRYYHDEVGWNSRLDSLQAAILSVHLPYLPERNSRRRALAARYDTLLGEAGLLDRGVIPPFVDPRATHVFHQYVIRAPRRDALRQYLSERRIGSEVYYPLPLHLQVALKHLGYKERDFPEAERAAEEVLALPIFPELRADEQETVVAALKSFYA